MKELVIDDTPFYLVAILYLALLAGFVWGMYLLRAAAVLIRHQNFRYKHLSSTMLGVFLVVCTVFSSWRISTGHGFGSMLVDQQSINLYRHNFRAPTCLSWTQVASIEVKHYRRGWHQWDILLIVDDRGNQYKSVACTTVAEKARLAQIADTIRRLHSSSVQVE